MFALEFLAKDNKVVKICREDFYEYIVNFVVAQDEFLFVSFTVFAHKQKYICITNVLNKLY